MIVASVLATKDKMIIRVESNNDHDVGDLDLIYQAIMSQRHKVGGYLSSNSFEISVPMSPE